MPPRVIPAPGINLKGSRKRPQSQTQGARARNPASSQSATADEAKSPQLTILRGRGQLTLSPEVRRHFALDEGDPVLVEITEEGILLRPRKLIDPRQAWFWSREWQEGERAADADLRAGRTKRFNSSEELLDWLEKH